MARREYYSSPQCAEPDCMERAHYVFSTRRDQHEEAERLRRKGGWRCFRHSDPKIVLSAESPEREFVYVNKDLPYTSHDGEVSSLGLFWCAPESDIGSGFASGPGFRAFAKDFPEGTRLVVTARVEIPRWSE